MTAHTQIPTFPTSPPAPAVLGNYSTVKTNSVALKRHLKKAGQELSLTRIEYRQNGKTTAESRAFPGRFHQGNTSPGGCLSTIPIQSSRNTRRGRASPGAPPAPDCGNTWLMEDGLNAIGPAFVAEPARFRKWR